MVGWPCCQPPMANRIEWGIRGLSWRGFAQQGRLKPSRKRLELVDANDAIEDDAADADDDDDDAEPE